MNHLESHVNRSGVAQQWTLLTAAIAYWVIAMGVWGIFSLDRGLNYETVFPLNCQKPDLYLCLIYLDNLRPYNSLFLGLSHLFGRDNGSYVSYQIFYGLLLWGRGFFTFLIFRRIFPHAPVMGFLIGAIAIAHVSDSAINWIGQIHQLGFMFCLVLAVYLLIESWYAQKKWQAALLLAVSLLPLYLSLWTYESQFFIILLIPGILLILRPKITLPFIVTTLIWYVLPVLYAVLQIQRYILTREATYQTSIVRPDLTVNAMLQDLGAHLQQSVRFWQWSSGVPQYTIAALAPVIGLLCAIAFVVAGYLVLRPQVLSYPLPSQRQLLWSAIVGGVILLLSFPIYLLIAGNAAFWRTQMLSNFGAAILLGSGVLLLARSLLPKKYQAIVALLCCAVIIFSGVRAGVVLQSFHEYRWRLHQIVMAQVAQLAPDVKDNTFVLLTNLSKDYNDDPFGASMWFDAPIRLLYPDRHVVGHFFYADGSQPADDRWRFTLTGIQRDKQGMFRSFERANYDQMLVFQYEKGGKVTLLNTIPPQLLPTAAQPEAYNPEARIESSLIRDRSIRMFAR